jgi:putative colanic acid biosynthesis glycosyltransferase
VKVLQINSVCGVGSTGRITTDLYSVLENQGHECLIAYGRGTAPEGIHSIKVGSDIDNYFHVIKTRLTDEHGFGSVSATKKFIKQIEEYNPDIIHLHNLHGYYINIEILFNYLKQADKPVVWTLHDCWAFTGHCSHFDYIGCEQWKTGCNNCPQKKEYPSSLLKDNSEMNYIKKKELFTSVKNMTIVTPSEWLASIVKKSFLGKYTVKVINNGINLDIFKPTGSDFREKYGLQDKYILLGVANVWDRRKGLNYFTELAKLLDDTYQIILVGVTEKQKQALPQNIIGITRTSNVNELVEIYGTADVFINPTLEDNFPTTNLEALACGTPVITFKTGGSIECIDESCGIVVEKGDIDTFIQAIEEMKSKSKSFYTNACMNRAKYNFDKNDRYNDYIELYNNQLMNRADENANTIKENSKSSVGIGIGS